MKLSFSISSKSSARTNPSKSKPPAPDADPADAEKPQFVTIFDPAQPLPSDAPSKLVIPPIPNADLLGPSRKPRPPLPLPNPDDPSALAAAETRFALDTSTGDAASSDIPYGLTLRSSAAAHSPNRELRRNSPPPQAVEETMLRRFKEDMRNLPEDRGFDEFRDVPVEGFGAALLAGYGWSEGKGIGRNNAKGDTKVVQYDRRAGTEGLGYNPSASDPKKRRGEWVPGDKNKEKAKETEKGRAFKEREWLVSNEGDKKSKRERKEDRERDSNEERMIDVHSSKRTSSSSAEKQGSVRWLRNHIRVRVISKEFRRGKFYLKKGEVVDVVGPTTCDISMDESRELVQGVDQGILETALPKRGGYVVVLYGKHKGVHGSLVERNSEEEMGVVRDADTHELFNVRLEQIAEYIGDPTYLGY